MNIVKKEEKRIRQKKRVQFKLKTVNVYNDRLRIVLTLSHLHCSVQVINNDGKTTLAYVSTQQKWFKDLKNIKPYNVIGAQKIGEKLGEILTKDFKNKNFYFDRAGKQYTGRVKAVADGIRSQGVIL